MAFYRIGVCRDVELRNSDGSTLYQEEVAVTVGQTTKLRVS